MSRYVLETMSFTINVRSPLLYGTNTTGEYLQKGVYVEMRTAHAFWGWMSLYAAGS